MPFDPASFEYEEDPDIAIADGAVGKLNLLIYVVIAAICLYYLFTQWSPDQASDLAEAARMVP